MKQGGRAAPKQGAITPAAHDDTTGDGGKPSSPFVLLWAARAILCSITEAERVYGSREQMVEAVRDATLYLLSIERMFKRLQQKHKEQEARRHRLALKRVQNYLEYEEE